MQSIRLIQLHVVARSNCAPAFLPSSWPLPCRERGCVGLHDFMRQWCWEDTRVGPVPNVVEERKLQWKIFRASDRLLCCSDWDGKQGRVWFGKHNWWRKGLKGYLRSSVGGTFRLECWENKFNTFKVFCNSIMWGQRSAWACRGQGWSTASSYAVFPGFSL